MRSRILIFMFLAVVFSGLIIPRVYAESNLSQYGEIASVYNDEVKLKCKDPLTADIYWFKFTLGWDTAFEGIPNKDGLKVGSLITVNYRLDISQKPIATKIIVSKNISNKEVSLSGLQVNEGENQEVKALKEEVRSLKEELNQVKLQLQGNKSE